MGCDVLSARVLHELSMGMSADYEVAVEEGANDRARRLVDLRRPLVRGQSKPLPPVVEQLRC